MSGGFTIKLNLSGKTLEGKAGKELYQVLGRELELVLTELKGEVSQEMPVGETGKARSGVSYKKVIKPGIGLNGKVYEKGPAKEYVEVIEQGRRAGKRQPSPRHLWRWLKYSSKGRAYVARAKAKYFADHKTTSGFSEAKLLRQIAWMKSKSIAKYGTPAFKPYGKTFKRDGF